MAKLDTRFEFEQRRLLGVIAKTVVLHCFRGDKNEHETGVSGITTDIRN